MNVSILEDVTGAFTYFSIWSAILLYSSISESGDSTPPCTLSAIFTSERTDA